MYVCIYAAYMWIYMQMHVLYGVSRYGISFDSRHWLRSQRKRKLTTEEATQDIVEKIRVETLKKSRHPPKRFTHTHTHKHIRSICTICGGLRWATWGPPLRWQLRVSRFCGVWSLESQNPGIPCHQSAGLFPTLCGPLERTVFLT